MGIAETLQCQVVSSLPISRVVPSSREASFPPPWSAGVRHSLSSALGPPEGPPKSGGRQTPEPPKWGSSPPPGTASAPRQHPSPSWEGRALVWVWLLKKKRKERLSRWQWGDQLTGNRSEQRRDLGTDACSLGGRGAPAHLGRGPLLREFPWALSPCPWRPVPGWEAQGGEPPAGLGSGWTSITYRALDPTRERGCHWAPFLAGGLWGEEPCPGF